MNEETRTQKEKPKQRRKMVFITILLLGITVGIWYIWEKIDGPAQGVITVGEQKFDVMHPDLPPEIVEFAGTYFSLYLPESYMEKRHETPDRDGNVREQVFFTEESGSGRKVAVTIEKRPQNGIRDFSSFQFRTLTPDEYERGSFQNKEDVVVVFNKKSPVYEITGYLEGDDFIATISVSSAIESPEKLMTDFSDIVKSFRWAHGGSQ